MTDEGKARISQVSSLKRNCRRQRQQVLAPLPNPVSLQQLQLPDEVLTLRGDNFLAYDSGAIAGRNRILIFATQQNLQVLA